MVDGIRKGRERVRDHLELTLVERDLARLPNDPQRPAHQEEHKRKNVLLNQHVNQA